MSFWGLELGKKSLQAQQVALDTIGHNISNANTEGYSRQRVEIKALAVDTNQFGMMGAGADVESITRARNEFIDDRIIAEKSEKAKWDVKETNLTHMQYIVNEPTDDSLRFVLDGFWTSLQDLSQNPEDSSTRITVKERGLDLVETLNGTYNQFSELKSNINDNVSIKVDEANTIIKQIADINEQVIKVESNQKIANDLKDQRDLLVEDLSEIVNVAVQRNDRTFNVSIGGHLAVQGDQYIQMEVQTDRTVNDGMYQIKWKDDGREVEVSNGEIQGLLELRDTESEKYLDYLDQLAIGLTDQINEVQNSGFDINGLKGIDFFSELSTENENVDINSDGTLESAIYKMVGGTIIEDSEDSVLDIDSEIETYSGNLEINGMVITYDTSKDRLKDIVDNINDLNSGVVAAIGANKQLVLRGDAESNYMINTLEDTNGTLLQDLGILNTGETKFDFRNELDLNKITTNRMGVPKSGAAERMQLKLVDVDKIAAATGTDTTGDGIADEANNSGDGSNALNLSSLKYGKTIGKYTYSDYFQTMVADLGVSGQQAERFVKNEGILLENLETKRQSEIGVSLDEEMANMIKYQHGYNAIAKYINTVNSMLDTLMNQL